MMFKEKISVLLTLLFLPAVTAMSQPVIFIETEEVVNLLIQPDVALIDARDKEEYDKAHIPGAVNIPKESFRKPEDIKYKAENGFLTSPEKAREVFGNAGIDENTRVIIYGTNAFPNASIPYAIFKQYGHDNVHVMRGDIEKWAAEERPLTTEINIAITKNFKARPVSETTATTDWLIDNSEDIIILDMRSFEEYTGFNTAGNPRGGHIPGAYPTEWKEFSDTVSAKTPEAMLEILIRNGVPVDKNKEYVTYCNWGVGRGSSGFMYLKSLGFEKVRIYGGSMEEWSKDTNLPVSNYELGSLE